MNVYILYITKVRRQLFHLWMFHIDPPTTRKNKVEMLANFIASLTQYLPFGQINSSDWISETTTHIPILPRLSSKNSLIES